MTSEPFDETKSHSENPLQGELSPIAQAFKKKLEDYCTGNPSAYIGNKTHKDDAPQAGNMFQYWIRKAVGTEVNASGTRLSPFKNPLGFLSRSPKKEEASGASLSRMFDAMQLLPESAAQFDLIELDTEPKTRLPKLIHEICIIVLNDDMTDLSSWMIEILEKSEKGAYERLLRHLEPTDSQLSPAEKRIQARQRLANEFIGAAIAFCPQKLTDVYNAKRTPANQEQILQYQYEDIDAIRDAYANRTTTPQTLRDSLQSWQANHKEAEGYYRTCLNGLALLRHYNLITQNKKLSEAIHQKLNVLIDKYQEYETAKEHGFSSDTRIREFLSAWSSLDIETELKAVARHVIEHYKTQLPIFDTLLLSKQGALYDMQLAAKPLHTRLVLQQQQLIDISPDNVIPIASRLLQEPEIMTIELYQLLSDMQHLSEQLPQITSDKIDTLFIQDKIFTTKIQVKKLIQELLQTKDTDQQKVIESIQQQMHSSIALISKHCQQNGPKTAVINELVALSNLNRTLTALSKLQGDLKERKSDHILLSEVNHRITQLKTKEKLSSEEMQDLEKNDLIYQLAFKYLILSSQSQSVDGKITSAEKKLRDECATLLTVCTDRVQEYWDIEEAKTKLEFLAQVINTPEIRLMIGQIKFELNKGTESANIKALITQIKELDSTYREILEEDLGKGVISAPLIESLEDDILSEVGPLLSAPKSSTPISSPQESKLPLWNLGRLRNQAASFITGRSSPSSETKNDEPESPHKKTMD